MIELHGTIQKGDGRGTKLGFPTANMEIGTECRDGVYASEIDFGRGYMPAMTFVGSAPTFDRQKRLAETVILDFEGDLYNTTVSVRLLKHMRAIRKCDTAAQLQELMREDERGVRAYFKQ